MARVSKSDSERAEAIARLREWIKPGDVVYTILRHRSRSGMSRTIDVLGIDPSEKGAGGSPRVFAFGWNVAKALGWTFDREREGVKVSGCGMDMGFHLVYAMSSAMFPEGFGCVGEGCPSNDHSNGDRDYTPHNAGEPLSGPMSLGNRPTFVTTRLGPDARVHWHRDGGYAIRSRWL